MFTKIVADIPLNIPGAKNPIRATLTLDALEGTIHLESADSQFKAVNHILDVMRVNNLLTMELNLKYIEADASNIPDSYRGKR